ncbi:uncharacterized protein BDFB_008538, partial [Asbolus verrucosus]
AKSSVALRVELVGWKEGDFLEEFWIKSVPPQRVVICGTFILPRLLVRKFISGLDFTLMEFKPTYFGSSSTKPLVIKNSSSSHSMFCVMAEIKGVIVPLEEAKQIDEKFKNFTIKPSDGRMAPDKGSVIQITFTPVKNVNKEKYYAACFLRVIRIDCRDVNDNDFNKYPISRDTVMNIASISQENISVEDTYSYRETIASIDIETTHLSFEHGIGVCLYGEKEQAGVILRPSFITLDDMILNETYDRVLHIENRSKCLPISVQYDKAASIIITPNHFVLEPCESREVKITIRSSRLGTISKKITFSLLAPDYPGDKVIIRKVGSASLKFYFKINSMMRKTRLEQCLLCYDLPLKKTRENAQVFTGILDYELTNTKLLQRQEVMCQNPPPEPKKIISFSKFYPLTPKQLYNIKITPKSKKLKKCAFQIAAFTSVTEHFLIQNLNPFPIRVLLKSSKACIVFLHDSRYVIHGREKKKIPFIFSTTTIGRYYVNINVLINDSALYVVAVVARVVPKTLKLESTTIDFTESDGHYKFFNLINGLNAYTTFSWDIPKGCFKIFPAEGGIKAESFLTSVVMYYPDPSQPNVTECTLTSESGQKKIVQLSYKRRKPSVVFDTYSIDLGVIPLNISIRKKLIMKNQKNFQVSYNLPEGIPVPGISIEPKDGILSGQDSQVFIISICLSVVIEFSTNITFAINEEDEIKIELKGIVDYPRFVLSPDTLYFRKIAPYSFDTLAFKVKNLSKCESYMTFPMADFPEFSITEYEENQFPHQKKIVLQPEEAKVFFLHFHPNYVSTYTFSLPYVINDIFGPTHLNSNQTLNPHYFLQENQSIYEHVDGVTIIKNLPKNLPVIRINCCAFEKFLEFSSLNINLIYFGEGHYNNLINTDFEIINTSNDTVRVCIRIDDLVLPFTLTLKSEKQIEYYDVSYMMQLEPGEKIVFVVGFQPSDLGEYSVKLPIFLRHYYDNKIFNYLNLKGVYKRPTIIPSSDCFDFAPIPVKIKNEYHLTLHMQNHFKNCEVTNETDLNGLCTIFETGRRANPGESYLKILLTYTAMKPNCFDTRLYFRCSCNSSCAITGDTVECELSSTSILCPKNLTVVVNKNITTYPCFPNDNDNSDYACYMRRLQKTLESWIYSQGFYLKSYYKIPEGFTYYCRIIEPKRKIPYASSKKPKPAELPLLQLIMNLVGREVRNSIITGQLESDDELEALTYTYKAYVGILSFFQGFKLYLPHVSAKLLLNYEQYCLYEKVKNFNNDPPMDKQTFYSYSKQCWIDLILQIIKTFFLYRIIENEELEEEEGEKGKVEEEHAQRNERSFSEVSGLFPDEDSQCKITFYGVHEKRLITWLEMCYEEVRFSLWNEITGIPPPKELIFFDDDLHDGLILGAVLGKYCPYIKHLIKTMYINPERPEETFHNACTLVKTWKLLRLSYDISPFAVQAGSMVEMLLLVTYLYNVLPSCYPQDTITIQAPLTQTNHAVIELQNLGQSTIVYQVVFFGNDNKLFRIAKDTISISPGKKKLIKITYHAKFVATAKATVLFSGETPGQKYSKSVAVDLVGIADVSHTCMDIALTVNLYKPCEVTLNVESPFKVKTAYSLLIGYQAPSSSTNKLYSWEEIKRIKIIRECIMQSDVYEFDENGMRTTKPIICCLEPGPRQLTLYYTNPEVGDWGVQITLTGKVTNDNFESIYVVLPDNYENLICRCKNGPDVTKNCPQLLNIKIPAKNNLLWDARKALMLQQIIDEPVEYDVVLAKNSPFVTMKSIVIEDVSSEDYVYLPIHPIKNLLEIESSILRL